MDIGRASARGVGEGKQGMQKSIVGDGSEGREAGTDRGDRDGAAETWCALPR